MGRVHAISASAFRFDRMSPPAMALALLLHAAVAVALWWATQHASRPAPPENAIEVTIEQPPPEPPKPQPPAPEPPKPEPLALPSPPILEGLPPPGMTSDRRTQMPGSKEQPKNVEDAEPAPQTALAALEPTPRPSPEPEPPRPPQKPVPPEPQARPQPTHPPEHRPAPQVQRPPPSTPSPLTAARPQAPPPVANPGQSTTSPFVNPADTYNRALASDNYLWEIARRLAGYRYQANVAVTQGVTVVRVVIARDGRLLDVSVVRSSGYAELDRGVVAGIRKGAPYSPLPPEIRGASASFDLPLVSVFR
jgi:TonB family protein